MSKQQVKLIFKSDSSKARNRFYYIVTHLKHVSGMYATITAEIKVRSVTIAIKELITIVQCKTFKKKRYKYFKMEGTRQQEENKAKNIIQQIQ